MFESILIFTPTISTCSHKPLVYYIQCMYVCMYVCMYGHVLHKLCICFIIFWTCSTNLYLYTVYLQPSQSLSEPLSPPMVWTRWTVVKCVFAVGMTAANLSGGLLLFQIVYNPQGRVSQWFHDSWIKEIAGMIWYRMLGADDDTWRNSDSPNICHEFMNLTLAVFLFVLENRFSFSRPDSLL